MISLGGMLIRRRPKTIIIPTDRTSPPISSFFRMILLLPFLSRATRPQVIGGRNKNRADATSRGARRERQFSEE
jgi:hypothetical protein